MPERALAERAEVLVALDDREEVVAGQLADDAGKQAAAVGKQDLRLGDAAGVDQDLAGRRVARVVLVAHPELEVAERDPGRLAAPADVDDLLLERQQFGERRTGLGRPLLLHPGPELVGARLDR